MQRGSAVRSLLFVAGVVVLSACEGIASEEEVPVDEIAAPTSIDQSELLKRRRPWRWWPSDAGVVTPAPVDAGLPVVDAGTPPRDAGSPVVDAGLPPPPPRDAGTPVVDAGTPPPPPPPSDAGTADVSFAINSTQNVKPISRTIYGKNFNGSTWAQEPAVTLNRLGGNRWTAYNWENNASCAGSDYNFQNDAYLGGGDVPGEAVRTHVVAARNAGGSVLVTVPIQGWVAADKLGTSTLGQPITSRFVSSIPTKSSALQYPPNLSDGVVNQDEFVRWLELTFPTAHQDPTRELFYSLDNEPDLWSDTHAEIQPNPVTYAELLDKSIRFASAIRTQSPQGKIFGFVSYGFNGFINLQNASDNGNRDFINFFLDGMRAAGTQQNKRLLDVLDLHWYPEATGGGTRVIGEDTSAAVVAARLQAPRSLWDPTYTETSWVASFNGAPLQLIPTVRAQIAAHYPGTGIAFTEYYYGGGAHISGALAQADVLGIFGREGVHTAALWPMSSTIPFISAAFSMFRSFDGAGGAFGDTSVQANNPSPANYSVYASVDAANPGRMVLVVINKQSTAKTAVLNVTHGTSFSRAQVFQLTSASPNPMRGNDVAVTGNSLRYTMPALSVTTLVLQ